jgi:hypothetical protein
MEHPQHRISLGVFRRIALPFLGLAAGVVAVVLLVLFSSATVTVFSAEQALSQDVTVDIVRHPVGSQVKGDVFEATGTVSQQFPATSAADIDAHAEGKVRISSALTRSQTLVATTRLLTADGKLYRIKKTVTVPANGSVEVDAFADAAGKAGETADATFTIPGLNPGVRELFTVKTSSPFVGGSVQAKAVTKSDVESAYTVLKDRAAKELSAKLEDRVAAFSGRLVSVEAVRQTTDVAAGTAAEGFTASVTVRVTAVGYDALAFAQAVEQGLTSKVPLGWRAKVDGTPALTVAQTDLQAGHASIRAAAKASLTIAPDNPDLVPEKFTGVTTEAAKAYVESLDGVKAVSIRVKPFWAGRLPTIVDHVAVEVR